eukprot:NODE_87_length_21935_cov_0.397142.p13 type:complete len:101 gc:universal NODE_87_length_21935_cov_0.397142:21701-21399(-)
MLGFGGISGGTLRLGNIGGSAMSINRFSLLGSSGGLTFSILFIMFNSFIPLTILFGSSGGVSRSIKLPIWLDLFGTISFLFVILILLFIVSPGVLISKSL